MKITEELLHQSLVALDILAVTWHNAMSEEAKKSLAKEGYDRCKNNSEAVSAYLTLSRAAADPNQIIDYIEDNFNAPPLSVMDKFHSASQEEKFKFFKSWHSQFCKLLSWVALETYEESFDDLKKLLSMFKAYPEEGHHIINEMLKVDYISFNSSGSYNFVGIIHSLIADLLPQSAPKSPARQLILNKMNALLNLVCQHPDLAQKAVSDYTFILSVCRACEIEHEDSALVVQSLLNVISTCPDPAPIINDLIFPSPIDSDMGSDVFKLLCSFIFNGVKEGAQLDYGRLLYRISFENYNDHYLPIEKRSITLQRMAQVLTILNAVSSEVLVRDTVVELMVFKRKTHKILVEGLDSHTFIMLAGELACYVAEPEQLTVMFEACSQEQNFLLRKIIDIECQLRKKNIGYDFYLNLCRDDAKTTALAEHSIFTFSKPRVEALHGKFLSFVEQGLPHATAVRLMQFDSVKNETDPVFDSLLSETMKNLPQLS